MSGENRGVISYYLTQLLLLPLKYFTWFDELCWYAVHTWWLVLFQVVNNALYFITSEIAVDDFFHNVTSVAITSYFGTRVISVYESNISFFIIGVTVIWWPRNAHIFNMMIRFGIACFRINCKVALSYTLHRCPLSRCERRVVFHSHMFLVYGRSFRCLQGLYDRHTVICLSLSMCVATHSPALMASARLALHSASYHLGALLLCLPFILHDWMFFYKLPIYNCQVSRRQYLYRTDRW